MTFLEIQVETDPEALFEEFADAMGEAFPGWVPSSGNLETWLGQAFARMTTELAELAADVPSEIFHRFGSTIVNVPPHEAAPASADAVWTMEDAAGYTIPEGTTVALPVAGDELVAFTTAEELTISPGDTSGSVTVVAVEDGEAGNGLTGTATLIDAVPWVDSVMVATTSGGVDAEDPDDYLDRLASEMQLLTPRPILPRDVEVLARRVPAVGKVVALDTYDATEEDYGFEKTVTVAIADADGEALAAGIKAKVAELLEAEREIGFVFFVIDPTYTEVAVTYAATALPTFDLAQVQADVDEALAAYLSPGRWGGSPFGEGEGIWRNVTHVYLNELIALIDRVPGVDRVISVVLGEEGGTLTAANLELDGAAPLPRPGTIGPA